MIRALALCLTIPLAVSAQEFASATSPDGLIQFTLDVDQPNSDGSTLPGLAYQVRYLGKLVFETSYLGFDVWEQEPMLGEKVGLSKSEVTKNVGYNAIYAEYLQQGSLGRRINIEARVFNRGVAFRYVIPPSAPLLDLWLRDEITEFHFAGDAGLQGVGSDYALRTPYITHLMGGAWVSIREADATDPFTLRHYEGNKLVLRVPKLASDPGLIVKSHPVWTSSWRVILIGPAEDSVRGATFLTQLPKRTSFK